MPDLDLDAQREVAGRAVREAWVARQRLKYLNATMEAGHAERKFADLARTWEQLDEFERETDRCIADAVLSRPAIPPDLDALQAAAEAMPDVWISVSGPSRIAEPIKEFIALAREAVPALIATVRQQGAELERQGEELAKLRAELAAAHQNHHSVCHEAAELKEQLGTLRAENDALRQAIEEIKDNCGCCEDMEPCANCNRADAALALRPHPERSDG